MDARAELPSGFSQSQSHFPGKTGSRDPHSGPPHGLCQAGLWGVGVTGQEVMGEPRTELGEGGGVPVRAQPPRLPWPRAQGLTAAP